MTGWLNKAGIVLVMLGAATAVPARADEEWPYTSYNLEMANKHYGRCDKLIKIGPESYYASCALWAILKGKLPRALDYAKAGMDYYAREEHGERPPRDDDSWHGYSLFMYGEALLLNGRKDEAYLAYLGLPARQLAEDRSKTTMSEDAFITGNKRLARLAQVLTDRDNEAEKALHPEAIAAIDEGWAKYLSKDYAGSLASYQRAAAADRSYCPTVQMIVLSKIELGVNFTHRKKTKTVDELDLNLKNSRAQSLVGSQYLLAPTSLDFVGFGNVLAWNLPAALDTYYTKTVLTDANHYDKSWSITEDLLTFKAKANFDTGNLHGNVGVQVVSQRQSSDGLRINQTVSPIAISPSHISDAYTDVLPSLNMYYDLGGGHRLRLAAAKVMARPRMDDMRANFTPSYSNPCASGGSSNVNCLPGGTVHPWWPLAAIPACSRGVPSRSI